MNLLVEKSSFHTIFTIFIFPVQNDALILKNMRVTKNKVLEQFESIKVLLNALA